ncbi:MAG: hypothetical protein LBF81_06970 [Prevotellaceae bacterium]|nr:hypothetical protein [Prevotellaceae bacterium]
MRTKFFFFTMFASIAASAQSHIKIEMLSATGNTWTRAEISTTPVVNSSPASTATYNDRCNRLSRNC